jgi:hypothetical protein
MEETWLPPAALSQVRSGQLPPPQPAREATPDLFSALDID